jgi:inner membrane protein
MPTTRLTGPALFAIVLLADALLKLIEPPYPALAVFDEPAHLATAALLLLAFSVRDRTVVVAALASSVLIDLDHLPQELGIDALTEHSARPVTHSIAGLVLITVAAAAVSRRHAIAAGVAFGIAAHLVRDLATGGGVPLLWPLTHREIAIPYVVYASVLVACAVMVSIRRIPALNRN